MGILQQIFDVLEPKNGEWCLHFEYVPERKGLLIVSLFSRHGKEKKTADYCIAEKEAMNDAILEAVIARLEMQMEESEASVDGALRTG